MKNLINYLNEASINKDLTKVENKEDVQFVTNFVDALTRTYYDIEHQNNVLISDVEISCNIPAAREIKINQQLAQLAGSIIQDCFGMVLSKYIDIKNLGERPIYDYVIDSHKIQIKVIKDKNVKHIINDAIRDANDYGIVIVYSVQNNNILIDTIYLFGKKNQSFGYLVKNNDSLKSKKLTLIDDEAILKIGK